MAKESTKWSISQEDGDMTIKISVSCEEGVPAWLEAKAREFIEWSKNPNQTKMNFDAEAA